MTDRLIARSRTTIVLAAGAVAAWAVTVDRMRGMEAGPGTDLGGLGWYLGIWVTMTAAMMLPSAAPAAGHVARVTRRVQASTGLFVVVGASPCALFLLCLCARCARCAFVVPRLCGSGFSRAVPSSSCNPRRPFRGFAFS